MSPPMRRTTPRVHSKSRSGCRTCKLRKIKCDEQQPSCRNCLKHGVECLSKPIVKDPRLRQISRTTTQDCNQPFGLSFVDLELLHHFTVSTCATLLPDPACRNILRVYVPQLGFSAEYVLHAILSLSALHIARFKPEQKDFYLSHAIRHHNASSAMALPLISNISTENIVPLYMFSVLTFVITLASPRHPSNLLIIDNDVIPEWLHLFQGIRSMMNAEKDALLSSPLAAIYHVKPKMCDFCELRLPSASGGFRELEQNMSTRGENNPCKDAILAREIGKLKLSYMYIYCNESPYKDEIRGMFTWLHQLSQEYLNLLKTKDNEALCVFAFFCVLLKRLEHNWWIEGWGVHVISQIYALLDEAHRPWIRWPIEEIGWVA